MTSSVAGVNRLSPPFVLFVPFKDKTSETKKIDNDIICCLERFACFQGQMNENLANIQALTLKNMECTTMVSLLHHEIIALSAKKKALLIEREGESIVTGKIQDVIAEIGKHRLGNRVKLKFIV